MRTWDLATPAGKLELAMEALRKAEAEAAARWNDDPSRQFQERFIRPLEPKFRRAVDAIRHLAEVLAQAERECDPDRVHTIE